MSWTLVLDAAAQDVAYKLARGKYQAGLVSGRENLSGSTLRGKAKHWGARYAESRSNFLDRLTANAVPWSERYGKNGRRILVIGEVRTSAELILALASTGELSLAASVEMAASLRKAFAS